jgi:hypothetical protein
MKRYRFIFLFAAAVSMFSGCEKFLDKSPDMGLDDADVYKDYNSISAYLDNCFTYLEQNLVSHYRGCVRQHAGTLSDEFASVDRDTQATFGNLGNWLKVTRDEAWEFGVNGQQPTRLSSNGIRVANNVIANMEAVTNLSETQRNELLGQAHFYRAWYYFQLLKRYGGMPLLDNAYAGVGDQNVPRVTYQESHGWMLRDLNAACDMLPDNWDDRNTGRPTKAAALAFRAMAQLYAASPLMQNGLDETTVREYDKQSAAQAAKFGWEALEHLRTNASYRMMTAAEYPNLFYFPRELATQPEFIWYNRNYINDGGATNHPKRTLRAFWLPSQSASGEIQLKDGDASSYNAPTQNMAEMYDKMGSDGIYYPITDANAEYDAVNAPFEDRDPRFANNFIVPGERFGIWNDGRPYYFPTYVGGFEWNAMRGMNGVAQNVYVGARQMTGYLCKKFIWPDALNFGNAGPATDRWVKNKYITVYIRYAQVYLDFAEASFEATGSATAKVEGCGMSAKDALNVVRNRVNVTDLPDYIVSDAEKFRAALRRERAVELMFENHRWWDIRRWMVAHTLFSPVNPIRGMEATPVQTITYSPNKAAPDFGRPTTDMSQITYTYSYYNLDREIRSFGMRNYWYPFTVADASSVPDFIQNPEW